MKRHLTFKLKSIYPDYKTVMPKDLQKRIGKCFKLVGSIKLGSKLDMYFEDGFKYTTSSLDIEGYINKRDGEGNVVFVTLLTKDIAYEFDVVDEEINIKIDE